ncbi:hypothetical protein FYZ48_25765 [Gimesia chilikensis]|uniref:hypothetical protein n=1 Tax=Gimesia chilikensis TaxID=2605989 RepID=UPI0011EE1FF8|nr:hypothetical protein [Gimesia chilikensis]KAA0131552.1 hypothetical protein FYZ48_25765 [Gimesia chilikensis]
MTDFHKPDSKRNNHQDHSPEPEGLNSLGIWGATGGILLMLLICLGVIKLTIHQFSTGFPLEHADQAWQQQQSSPGVAPNQAYDRQRQQSREAQILDSYAWQDAEHQRARIPLERAIELLSEQGLQAFPEDTDQQSGDQQP